MKESVGLKDAKDKKDPLRRSSRGVAMKPKRRSSLAKSLMKVSAAKGVNPIEVLQEQDVKERTPDKRPKLIRVGSESNMNKTASRVGPASRVGRAKVLASGGRGVSPACFGSNSGSSSSSMHGKMRSTATSKSATTSGTTEDDQRGYNREREYLERTLGGLKKKLVKDSGSNRTDRARIVNEHVTLIKEINELRREVRTLNAAKEQAGGDAAAAAGSTSPGSKRTEGAQRELQIQRAEIYRLRGRVEELERDLHAAGRAVSTIPS